MKLGKEVSILTKKTVIAGKKVVVAYFVVEGWSLDEYGDLVGEVKGEGEGGIPF